MSHTGDVGTEIAPEMVDDPVLAARIDDLLRRTCDLARALTGAEQAALKVDLDGDGHAARKFFNVSEQYARWLAAPVCGDEGRNCGLSSSRTRAAGPSSRPRTATATAELAAYAGATLDAVRAATSRAT